MNLKNRDNGFVMLCGLPGAGKTAIAKQLIEEIEEAVWVSSDDLREKLLGDVSNQSKNTEIFDQMLFRTKEALESGKTVIYDATNYNSSRRIALLESLHKYKCLKECIICATPYEECLKRNQCRERNVENSVIKRMYMSWQTPAYFEGWDRIIIKYADNTRGGLGKPEEFVKEYMDFQQDSPFHTETLGVHLKNTAKYMMEKFGYEEDSNEVTAALLHDCGKPLTKNFLDKRQLMTEIAHYYQHESVGAYNAMFFEYANKTDEDILEITSYICYHMRPFGWKEEKPKSKCRKKWGEEFFQIIEKIHEADKAASESEL